MIPRRKSDARRLDRYGTGLRGIVKMLMERTPYRLSRRYEVDLSEETIAVMKRVAPLTMVSPARLAETIRATEYVCRHGIPGAIVECGVWRGGGMMAVALTMLRLGEPNRDLYLFDTFEGMTEPSERDHMLGTPARRVSETHRAGGSGAWLRASLEGVCEALDSTGYDRSRVHLVEGRVEDTLPTEAPEAISLLRLDTDFYESTRHELVHLFPRLSIGGVLILDDYGVWGGARQAADEYFAENQIRIFLGRTDNSGRAAIKQPLAEKTISR